MFCCLLTALIRLDVAEDSLDLHVGLSQVADEECRVEYEHVHLLFMQFFANLS
jgi:hypothetical protein